ncbi:MAG: hypothetical protein H6751_13615 [Candidatus Omnitrophica bacterium]|nr:hypothetical protein [Candidatus Omnitrophota bacterium]MCA9444123.1 hypothetical protein [Candidatus Omnitrophota bacterium]MCB9783995.1 hypothetical protein [Candidatus Omnitrophota bacterium]
MDRRRFRTALLIGSSVILVLAFLVVDFTIFRHYRYESLIVKTMQNLALGQPIEEVTETVIDLGWDEDQILLSSEDSIFLDTPFQFGADNWILYLGFEKDRLVAMKVRTPDSLYYHPKDAPPDIVDPNVETPY